MVSSITIFTSRKKTLSLLFFLVIVTGLLFALWLQGERSLENRAAISGGQAGTYPEVRELADRKLSFEGLAGYFTDLAEKKGGGYAFDVLRAAPMPPDIDMHLLAHIAGDVLYRQEGLEGISVCTHDFRNACSHSIVIGLFFEEGETALDKIAEACRKAPGGSGAYTMCFHGLGHGVLAYSGYDLLRAVDLCKKTGTPQYNDQEAHQCISGTIMEIINGVHDRELWEKQHKKYFKDDDPLYPCSAEFMPDRARPLCYVYLTPHLFDVVGMDKGFPTPADFKKAFGLCDKLPESDAVNRDRCYGGFGKEFIVLALDRDIRLASLEHIGDEQFLRVYEWCKLAGNKEGTAACIMHAMNSLYWGGENDRSIAIRFCNVVSDSYYRRPCFMNLINNVFYYVQDSVYREEFCEELPATYSQICQAR